MAKKTYVANWQLDLDGKTYTTGEKVTIEEKEAQPLVVCGVLSSPAKAPEPANPDPAA